MKSTPKKAGRKPQHHVTAENDTIVGLIRQPDGRWRIMATGARFTEPDEKLAVARFHRMSGTDAPADAILLTTTEPERRPKEEFVKLAQAVVDFLRKNPGSKSSEVVAAVGEIPKPLNPKSLVKKYLPDEEVTTEGERSAMVYSLA